jgi:hypothetical protein
MGLWIIGMVRMTLDMKPSSHVLTITMLTSCVDSPGRFHAALVMKMVLVHLVSNYDFRFEDEKARRQFRWETFTMPYESTQVLLRQRAS